MGIFYNELQDGDREWIEQQNIFWVATAPTSPDGHVNVSPKGINGTFRVVNKNKCWYQDLTGSGVETIAHLRDNGRITIMLTSFQGSPKTMRLYGTGRVHEVGSPDFERLLPKSVRLPGARSVIEVDIQKVGVSSGNGVPTMKLDKPRTIIQDVFSQLEEKDQQATNGADPQGLKTYWARYNSGSVDGLPGLQVARKIAAEQHLPLWGKGVFGGVKRTGLQNLRPEVFVLVGMFLGITVVGGWHVILDALRVPKIHAA
jgi:hypothetical protein